MRSTAYTIPGQTKRPPQMDGLMKGSGEHHQSIQPKQPGSLSNKPDGDNTDVAGLKSKQEVVLNVWEDGTVEVSKEGVIATDARGQQWYSKKVRLRDKIAIIFLYP
jgi:hypothetical protein